MREAEAMLLVRADLGDRLERLEKAAGRMRPVELAEGVEAIHALAAAYGLVPVTALASALGHALRLDPRACPTSLYLDGLRDAISCRRRDAAAGEALLASVRVRLGG